MELFDKVNREDLERLFDNFYQYNDQVLQFRDYTNQVIEIPHADPATFRKVSGFYADHQHVFKERLCHDSPPKSITNQYGHQINNPDAKWEITTIEGLDGKTFNYVKDKYDTVYWKDKNGIYFRKDGNLISIPGVDHASFEYLDFLYSKDKSHIYYEGNILPIEVADYSLDHWGFIKDKYRIFHYDFEIGLDPQSFEVEYYNLIKQPILLLDKNGKYEYTRSIQSDAKIIKVDSF